MKAVVTNLKKLDNQDSSTKAICSLVIEDTLFINDIAIVEGKNGYFISFPKREYEKDGEKKYSPVVAPTSNEKMAALRKIILEAFNNDSVVEK